MEILKFVNILFLLSWISSRIFWLYIKFVNIKFYDDINFNSFQYFCYMVIYLLSIKWTIASLKLNTCNSYSSILLGLPMFLSMENLNNNQFLSILNLTIFSFIHHIIKNKYTLLIDSFNISYTCLAYLNFSVDKCITISLLSTSDLITDIVFFKKRN